jgi:hypothetical protein
VSRAVITLIGVSRSSAARMFLNSHHITDINTFYFFVSCGKIFVVHLNFVSYWSVSERQEVGIQFPVGTKYFFLHQCVPSGSEDHSAV